MPSNYEIRAIKPASIFKYYFCSSCTKVAKFYLVRKPSLPMDRRESRTRRCEEHARADAKSLRIAFPEVPNGK